MLNERYLTSVSKKTLTNYSAVSLLWFVQIILKQTLFYWYYRKWFFLFVLINLKQPLSNYCQPFYFMKLTQELRCVISITFVTSSRSGITGGWAGGVDAHLGFGRIEGATRQRWHVELLMAHPV